MPRKKRAAAPGKGLALVFALLFALSAGMLLRNQCRAARERRANAELVQRVEQAGAASRPVSCPDAPAQDASSRPEAEPERDYLPLLQENTDLAAWLTVAGTEIDYPVMFTPDEPERYLRKAFDGSYAYSGSLFIGAGCTPDGSNIIVYGHNMEDGSMFGGLDAYADEAFARAHPEMTYDLIHPDGSYVRIRFEVMAAFYSSVYKVDEEGVFRYYYATDLSDPAEFRSYVQEVFAASLYDLGAAPEYGDQLLTLSTCSYHTDGGRFVVVARRCS